MNKKVISKIWAERPPDLHQEVYGQLGNPVDDEVEAWAKRLALAALQAAPAPESTDHGALDYLDELAHHIEGLSTEEERRVGYWGRDTMPCGVAFAGVLHLEATPRSFAALCNGQRFSFVATPSDILGDRGLQIPALRICKRCEKKAHDIEFSVVDEPQSGNDSTLIDWSELDRLSNADRAKYFGKALLAIDDALATAPRNKRLAQVETILMNLGSAENLKV